MEINTHGFEVDENEHDVVDKVYSELTPMLNPSRWVRLLRDRAGNEHRFACMDSEDWQIADYIERLETKLARTAEAAFNEGFLAAAADGWTNNPRIEIEWKRSECRAALAELEPRNE